MSLKMKKVFVSLFFSLFLVFAVAGGVQAYSNVLAFGDSLSDNGAADGFGIKKMSNGDVWVEYLANNLGASITDWACAGATSGTDAPALAAYGLDSTKFGLQYQYGVYDYYYNSIAANTLITISAGGNDMFNGRNAATAAGNIAWTIGQLIGMGGNAFMVMNLSTNGQTNPGYVTWMETFNSTLAYYLYVLGASNPNVTFYSLDMNAFVADADNYTGTWLANSCESPYSNPATCTNETFAWYDTVGVHPTTEVHEQIGRYATNMVPEPASIILLILGFAGLAGARRRMK